MLWALAHCSQHLATPRVGNLLSGTFSLFRFPRTHPSHAHLHHPHSRHPHHPHPYRHHSLICHRHQHQKFYLAAIAVIIMCTCSMMWWRWALPLVPVKREGNGKPHYHSSHRPWLVRFVRPRLHCQPHLQTHRGHWNSLAFSLMTFLSTLPSWHVRAARNGSLPRTSLPSCLFGVPRHRPAMRPLWRPCLLPESGSMPLLCWKG